MIISDSGITVEVKSQTIRTRMYRRAIIVKLLDPVLNNFDSDIGLSGDDVNAYLGNLMEISIRVEVVEGELDFDMLTIHDTPEEIKVKFLAFVDSKQLSLYDKIIDAIVKVDRVQDVALAPTPPPENDKKK